MRAGTRKQSQRPGPRDEGMHLLGRPRGPPPTKASVLLYLSPSLHLQGCSAFIGATQEPCTGSGAALRTCGADRPVREAAGQAAWQARRNLPAKSLRRHQSPSGVGAWSSASDFRIQTGLSCLMQPPSRSSPRGAALPCLVVYGFSVALRIPESCVKFGGAERCLHCCLIRI